MVSNKEKPFYNKIPHRTEIREMLEKRPGEQAPPERDIQPDPKRLEARTQLAQLEIPYTAEEFFARATDRDYDAFLLFVRAGMNPNECGHVQNHGGRFSSLGLAILNEWEDLVPLLLDTGADPHACDGEFLWRAAYEGRIDLLQMMQEKGIDILHEPGTTYEVALALAIESGRAETVQYLLAVGADVNGIGDYRDNYHPILSIAARTGQNQIVDLLLRNGAEIERRAKNGQTALMNAASAGHVETVRLLLEQGAKVNATDEKGGTALMQAILEKHANVVRALVEKGADINIMGRPANWEMQPVGTALIQAVDRDYYEIVEYLLQYGADPNASTPEGTTAMLLAMDKYRTRIMEILAVQGANVNVAGPKTGQTPLMRVAWEGDLKATATMLAHGADVNAIDKEGGTALMAAAYRGHVEVVRALLDKGADVNMKGKPANIRKDLAAVGDTALKQAERQDHDGIVDLLLDHGAK
jgi:ankyrin repeat protein